MLSRNMGIIPTVYILSLKGRRSSNVDLRKKKIKSEGFQT